MYIWDISSWFLKLFNGFYFLQEKWYSFIVSFLGFVFFILISLCFILQKAGFFIFSFNTLSWLLLASHTHIYMYIYIQFKLVDNSAQFSFFPLHERYYVFSNLFLLVIHVCKINFMWAIWLGSFCINFM